MQLYPEPALSVKPAFAAPVFSERSELMPAVSAPAARFFRWLANWHDQTGDVWASTPYLSDKSARSETTVYRWLRELRQTGYIACDVVQGVERRIIPLTDGGMAQLARDARRGPQRLNARKHSPPKLSYKRTQTQQPNSKKVTGVMTGVMTGVLPVASRLEEKTTTRNPAEKHDKQNNKQPEDCLSGSAIAALISTGVVRQTAAQLVEQVGPDAVLEQVSALPHRRAENKAAVVIASIKNGWSIPHAVKNAHNALKQAEKRQADKVAQQRAETLLRAKEAAKLADLEQRLAGMTAHERSELQKQAVGLWKQEKPGSFAVMAEKAGGAVVLREYMARIIEATAAKSTA